LLSPIQDIDLWNAATQGDREAFGQLFSRHYQLLFQYGNKITADRQLLEDAIQELFVELWQKRSSLKITSVKAYLLQALKFKLYKSFRDQKPLNSLDEDNEERFEISHENFMINQHEDIEKTKEVLKSINLLPVRQREIIYLKIYKGLGYDEIGKIMDLNYQGARNLLSQALKTLREVHRP
jgi:RNA polymerase sigma factor (sigma-70 family)